MVVRPICGFHVLGSAELQQVNRSRHARANCLSNGDALRVKALQAMHVDTQVVRRHSFAMEWIDATGLAEKVPGRFGVELVFSE